MDLEIMQLRAQIEIKQEELDDAEQDYNKQIKKGDEEKIKQGREKIEEIKAEIELLEEKLKKKEKSNDRGSSREDEEDTYQIREEVEEQERQLHGITEIEEYEVRPRDEQQRQPSTQNSAKEIMDKEYGDMFTTENAVKIEDKALVSKLLEHSGVSPFADMEIYLVEQGDEEYGDSLYGLFMVDKNGRVQQIDMPIEKEGQEVRVDSKPELVSLDGNKKFYSKGQEAEAIFTWKLADGTELTPYKTQDGKLHLGQEDSIGREGYIDSVETTDMLDREEQEQEQEDKPYYLINKEGKITWYSKEEMDAIYKEIREKRARNAGNNELHQEEPTDFDDFRIEKNPDYEEPTDFDEFIIEKEEESSDYIEPTDFDDFTVEEEEENPDYIEPTDFDDFELEEESSDTVPSELSPEDEKFFSELELDEEFSLSVEELWSRVKNVPYQYKEDVERRLKTEERDFVERRGGRMW